MVPTTSARIVLTSVVFGRSGFEPKSISLTLFPSLSLSLSLSALPISLRQFYPRVRKFQGRYYPRLHGPEHVESPVPWHKVSCRLERCEGVRFTPGSPLFILPDPGCECSEAFPGLSGEKTRKIYKASTLQNTPRASPYVYTLCVSGDG